MAFPHIFKIAKKNIELFIYGRIVAADLLSAMSGNVTNILFTLHFWCNFVRKVLSFSHTHLMFTKVHIEQNLKTLNGAIFHLYIL